MADLKAFIKKWHGRVLQDDGCRVSKEFHSFQVSFFNAMKKIAESIGAELVNRSYGHYDMSGFIKRGDKYVYFNYSSSLCGGRTQVLLKGNRYGEFYYPMYFRTAESDHDFRGGTNNFHSFEGCEELIDNLLSQEHRKW
jgi:hypothetical protein